MSLRHSSAVAEPLEPRRLLTTLFLNGTEGDDRMTLVKIFDELGALGEPGFYYVYYLNQQTAGTYFAEDYGPAAPIYDSIVMTGGGGDDVITHSNLLVSSTTDHLRIRAGSGNDEIFLDSIHQDLYAPEVYGEGGSDRLEIYEPAGFLDEFTIAANEFRITGTNRNVSFYGVEDVQVELPNTHNTIHVTGTAPGSTLTVYSGDGNNEIHVGDYDMDVNLNGYGINLYTEGGTDTVYLEDTAGTGADEYSLVSTGSFKPGVHTIFFPEVERIRLNAGTGANVIDVPYLSEGVSVTVNGSAGDDQVHIGDGDLDTFQGNIFVTDTFGNDTITLHDENDSVARSYGITSLSMSRSGGGSVSYSSGLFEHLLVQGSTRGSSYNVSSVSQQTELSIDAGDLNDSFGIGSPANNVEIVLGAVNVYAGDGIDNLSYDDHSSSTATQDYEVTGNTVRRVGRGLVLSTGVETHVLNAHDGPGTFSIQSVASLTSMIINGNGGLDSFEVAKNNRNVQQVMRGVLTVNGGEGEDVLGYYDQDDTGDDEYEISNSAITKAGSGSPTRTVHYSSMALVLIGANTGSNQITVRSLGDPSSSVETDLFVTAGAGADDIFFGTGDLGIFLGDMLVYGEAGIDELVVRDHLSLSDAAHTVMAGSYARDAVTMVSHYTVESVRLEAGGGNNVIDMLGVPAGGASIYAGGGDDQVTNSSGTLSSLAAPVLVEGQAGSDTIDLADHNFAAVAQYQITSSAVTRSGFSLTYGSAERVTLRTAATAGTWTRVTGTAAGTPLTVFAHPLNDRIEVLETHPAAPVTANVPALGELDLLVNPDGLGTASVLIDRNVTFLGALDVGNGGLVSIAPGGFRLLYTGQLNLAGSARFDLNDNELVAEPPGVPALNALLQKVNGYVVSGRAGGTWTGPGLSSSFASADPVNRLVGVGINPTQTGVRARLTLPGDANLDRKVDITDLGIFATNWQHSPRVFSQGDFNYDNIINVTDLGMLATNWQKALPSAALAKPSSSARRPSRIIEQVTTL